MEWEYTCETFDGVIALSQQLNKLGHDGWEVIAVLPQTGTMPNVVIAKRSNSPRCTFLWRASGTGPICPTLRPET